MKTVYIEEQIKNLPAKPGVYIMKDENENIIYVGKAISLKNRVRQYFRESNADPKVRAMVAKINEFEYIITDNELEALILENNLIKKHKPHYNILLKDDKTYPYIKITKEDYPRIFKTRKILKDGAQYFGPYTNIFALNDYIDAINDIFMIRDCNRNIEKSISNRERPCLNYYIKKCSAPCNDKISKHEYQSEVKRAIQILEGNTQIIEEYLTQKMYKASSDLNFEEAAKYRDKLTNMDKLYEKQKIVSNDIDKNQDYIVYSNDDINVVFSVFFIRNGKVMGQESFYFERNLDNIDEMYNSFLIQYYFEKDALPDEIVIEKDISDRGLLEEYLGNRKSKKMKILVPQKGKKKDMLDFAKKNAHEQFKIKSIKELNNRSHFESSLKELSSLLGLDNISVIESYDISNIQGTSSVGVKVVYKKGKKSPKDYRRYRIKSLTDKSDDYASMREVIERRMKDPELPDLILLDGGKGHVSTIKALFRELKIEVPVFGIYKDKNHRTEGLCSDTEIMEINKRSSLFKFLTGIQDETHRFAIDYHRNIRNKNMIKSELDGIKGIGEKRKTALFNKYGSIDNLKKASVDEISSIPGFNKNIAENILNYFKEL
ncbi:excinuclease ABC subunit UvrC [Proteocatella sphenisci]|uniref:excinuclease ABC subunit UvrC n=1 Tax=Proteocatella sphenisci TaxID=181070 RepID=UPI0004B5D2C0|nr:excinuclease ABC subunit UvrC [Proteocatella sphenisci]